MSSATLEFIGTPHDKRRNWSREDCDQLLAMCEGDHTTKEISDVLGRTIRAVNKQRREMHLSSLRLWTKSEVARLVVLNESADSLDEVAMALGRSTPAVRKKLRSEGINSLPCLTEQQLINVKLNDILLENVEFLLDANRLTFEEMEERLGYDESRLTYILNNQRPDLLEKLRANRTKLRGHSGTSATR